MLSIIVPTYNCADYLEEGIKSVLDQLSTEDELIVIDDGSTDGTKQKLSAYEGLKDNLRIHYSQYGGASAAKNIGLDLAKGDYIAFMDCDDCLREGFLDQAKSLLDQKADLYIFGIECVPIEGSADLWTVPDREYLTVSDFADEYIRARKLLIYSNCNKLYRRSIIEELGLRFEEGINYGEDRLFNYRYLTGCSKISDNTPSVITSALVMLRYIQRREQSMSSKQMSEYLEQITRLHDEKMFCFLALSEGTTQEERQEFMDYDLSKEIKIAEERFKK